MRKSLGSKLSDRRFQSLFFLLVSLIIFNIAFISSGGWARLVWNTLGYACLFLTYRLASLSLSSIGLSKSKIKPGLKYAAYVIGVIFLAMIIAFLVDKALFKDNRYHHPLSTAFYSVIILLPLKTIFFEELAFRGILPAILLKIKNQRRFAAILSSLAFGLWHIFSATKIGDYHIASISIPNALVVVGVFIATSFAGYLFYELRTRSGSLVAPIAVHWFLNGFGIILASLSWS